MKPDFFFSHTSPPPEHFLFLWDTNEKKGKRKYCSVADIADMDATVTVLSICYCLTWLSSVRQITIYTNARRLVLVTSSFRPSTGLQDHGPQSMSLLVLMSTSNIFSLLLALNQSTSIHWVPPYCQRRRPPTSALVPTLFHLIVIDFLSCKLVPLKYHFRK